MPTLSLPSTLRYVPVGAAPLQSRPAVPLQPIVLPQHVRDAMAAPPYRVGVTAAKVALGLVGVVALGWVGMLVWTSTGNDKPLTESETAVLKIQGVLWSAPDEKGWPTGPAWRDEEASYRTAYDAGVWNLCDLPRLTKLIKAGYRFWREPAAQSAAPQTVPVAPPAIVTPAPAVPPQLASRPAAPPDVKVPPGVTLPPGIQVPPGTTLPPGFQMPG